jgi:anti-anti-sigma regulatory factor
MLKIVALEPADGRVVLRLEGQIVGPWVDEVERACGEVSTRALCLDLSQVSFVERRGAELLRALGNRGIPLLHCSPFVSEQLRAQR